MRTRSNRHKGRLRGRRSEESEVKTNRAPVNSNRRQPKQANGKASPQDIAVTVWEQIVANLKGAGYAEAGPEYLRLSQLLKETRHGDLMQGTAQDSEQWDRLRELGAEALELLTPIADAAAALARLPDRMQSAKPPPAVTGRNGKQQPLLTDSDAGIVVG